MQGLKKAQKDKVRSLISFTGARCSSRSLGHFYKPAPHLTAPSPLRSRARSESMAIECLSAAGWALDAAADLFFQAGVASEPSVDAGKIASLFDKYKDAGAETIGIAGIEQLCKDLGVDPTDPIMLLISWQMGCETMCVFTRQEWTRGMTDMGFDSVEGLREGFDSLRAMLEDDDNYRDYVRS